MADDHYTMLSPDSKRGVLLAMAGGRSEASELPGLYPQQYPSAFGFPTPSHASPGKLESVAMGPDPTPSVTIIICPQGRMGRV